MYLQLHWLKKGTKACFVFSMIDFIELILHLPRTVRIHKELQCMVFNQADLTLMLKIGYEQVIASLTSVPDFFLEEMTTSKRDKHELQKVIEECLANHSAHHLDSTPRPLKVSLNSAKTIHRRNHMDIIHKGIFRIKDKTLCGMFSSKEDPNLTIKMYN